MLHNKTIYLVPGNRIRGYEGGHHHRRCLHIMQKITDIGIHLKVDEEQSRIAQGSKRQVSGEPP